MKNIKTLILGLLFGMVFGFLLQKGGATKYDVIVSQLLLMDNTVVKIMLSAVITGMVGIYLMKEFGLVTLYTKPGSLGTNVTGGLIFGIGFAVLGYCPGTIAGAIGNGYLDAALGGTAGILAGSYIYAIFYPNLFKKLNKIGNYGNKTIPQLLRVYDWVMIFFTVCIVFSIFMILEVSLP